MDFFQALGVSAPRLSELTDIESPSSESLSTLALTIGSDLADHGSAVCVALTHVPDLSVIAEKFSRLERFCATLNRVDFTLPPPADHQLSGVYDGDPDALTLGAAKVGLLAALVGRADFSAPALSLQLESSGFSFDLRVQDAPELPELDSSSSAKITDHLRSLIAADPSRGWRIDQAAAYLGLTGRSLQRYLLAEKSTFSKILRRARTDVARKLLMEKGTTLAEIGYCCGYADQAHFQREFRKEVGITPRKYRLGQRAV